MKLQFVLLILICVFWSYRTEYTDGSRFPDDFLFGVATSSYQIEGALHEGGRSEGIWDRSIRLDPNFIPYGGNAEIAADSYNLYKRDVEMLKELNVDVYRFSISWPRLMPDGKPHSLNPEGVTYYNNVINELLKSNITPMVTLYHWDLPQVVEDEGGFLNDDFAQWFEDFARTVYDMFADRVKYWITFNEPDEICVEGYGMKMRAPRRNFHGYGEYICAANLLKAHARAYRLYNDTYKPRFGGKVGIAFGAQWPLPMNEDSAEHRRLADISLQFHVGLVSHPIFSFEGGYPKAVVDRVPHDRLIPIPVDNIKNTADFIGINHYDIILISENINSTYEVPSFQNDLNITSHLLKPWSKRWMQEGVKGLGHLLDWVKINYNDPEIFITENGFPGDPGLDDPTRIWYYRRLLAEVLLAMKWEIKILGYIAWSLMDNFEWQRGYKERFGFYEIDFDDSGKTRTPRKSAFVYRNIVDTRKIDPDYLNQVHFKSDNVLKNLSSYKFSPIFANYSTSNAVNNGKNTSEIDSVIEALHLQILSYDENEIFI